MRTLCPAGFPSRAIVSPLPPGRVRVKVLKAEGSDDGGVVDSACSATLNSEPN